MKTSILILAVVMSSLLTQAQSRIGSGDQGIQGLLAATTRQIVPGSEVVVEVPDANSNERILVTADGPITTDQKSDTKYCVVLIKKYKYGSVNFDSQGDYRICTEVGTAVYVKGDFKIAIQFSNSIAYFEKKNDEALIIKLSKIQIPENDKLSYSLVTRDFTNQEELNKMLFTYWLDSNTSIGGEHQCELAINFSKENCVKYVRGDFSILKEYLKFLPDQNVEFRGGKIEKRISGVGYKGGTVYALPGVYKITWVYKDSNAYQVTSGIVLK